ncbi:DUF4166 domain-containing protein [Pseudoxanthomonas kalamensis]|uniref:DUF4166 domain-containing protein n=1 Tax=Pseudoxanthomonas kalamensis TaxID=289483 RepID=UPI001FEA6F59|nr:DUF4166 domain-containing protein [Pseudoxanthomonas kalamensis]
MSAPAPTLYQRLLGAAFFKLPESLRRLHAVRGRAVYAGMSMIERGDGLLARLCGKVAGLPPAMCDAPTRVEFLCDERGETWRREFGGHRMTSRLSFRDGWLHERLGLLRFRFDLHARDGIVWWSCNGARLLGVLPLPARMLSQLQCREREHEGRYEFRVDVRMPLVGRLIRYEGWLQPAMQASPDEGREALSVAKS